jgi:hypothetical protein
VVRYCLALEVTGSSPHPEIQRALEGWAKQPDVVYLWDDHTVTILPLPDSEPALAPDSDHWHEFCAQALRADPAA